MDQNHFVSQHIPSSQATDLVPINDFDLATNTPDVVAQNLATELGQIMSSRVRQEEKALDAEKEQKEVQYRSAAGFTENFLYLAVFTVPVAFLFYTVLRGPIQDYFNENILPEFTDGSKPAPKPVTHHATHVDWGQILPIVFIVVTVIAAIAIAGTTYFALRARKLKKFIMSQDEYDTRRAALENVTRDLVAPEAQKAALSTLQDLYAIHEHIQQHPDAISEHRDQLVNVYGNVVLAGRMVQEIDDYNKTRETVNEIGDKNPDHELSLAQKDVTSTLETEKQDLLGHVEEIAQHVSVLRGEMLQLESQSIQAKTLLPAQAVKTVQDVAEVNAALSKKMDLAKEQLST